MQFPSYNECYDAFPRQLISNIHVSNKKRGAFVPLSRKAPLPFSSGDEVLTTLILVFFEEEILLSWIIRPDIFDAVVCVSLVLYLL